MLKLIILTIIGLSLNAEVTEKFELYKFNIKDLQECNSLNKNNILDSCYDKYTFNFYYKHTNNIIQKDKVPLCEKSEKNNEFTNMINVKTHLMIRESPSKNIEVKGNKTITNDIYINNGNEFLINTCRTKNNLFYKVINRKYINEPIN